MHAVIMLTNEKISRLPLAIFPITVQLRWTNNVTKMGQNNAEQLISGRNYFFQAGIQSNVLKE